MARIPSLNVRTSILVTSLALLAGLLQGCAGNGSIEEIDDEQDSIELGETQQAIAAANAAQLAYPEYDLNVPVPGWWMHSASVATVQAKINEGYRLHDVEYLSGSTSLFTANFVQNTGVYQRTGQGWASGLTKAALEAIVADPTRRVVDIAKTGSGGSAQWAAVWVANTGTQQRTYSVITDQSQAQFQTSASGFRVTSLTAGSDGLISGVLLNNVGMDARTQWFASGTSTGLRDAQLDNYKKCAAGTEPCKRLLDIVSTGNDTFFAVFEASVTQASATDPNTLLLSEGEQTWWVGALDYHAGDIDRPDSIEHAMARLVARPTKLKTYADENGAQHYLAVLAANGNLPRGGDRADDNAATASLDAVIQKQMQQAGLPGMLFGVMRDGKLVHAKGYGWADMQGQRVMQPTDSLRIASVSKSVAKAAMLRVIQDGGVLPGTNTPVTLNTKPWGTIFPYNTSQVTWSPNLGDVTIEHLLGHTSGLRADLQGGCADGDSGTEYCHPFEWLMTPAEWVAKEAEVEAAPGIVGGAFYYNDGTTVADPAMPGSVYLYKNAHYHMIGHVIEAITGMTFENYVKLKFLNPLNLDRLRIGKLHADPQPPGIFQGTHYQLPEFFSNGVWNDHGDWVLDNPDRQPASAYAASPIDILRWQASLEGTTPGYRGLNASSWTTMGSTSHGGYLPGTTVAGLIEFPVGATKFVYFYALDSDTMNGAMFRIDNEVQAWLAANGGNLPNRDLFSSYLNPPCLLYFHNLPVADFQACFDYHTAFGRVPKTLTVSQDGQRISGGFISGSNRRTHHLLSGATYNAVNLEELAKGSVPLFTNVVNVGSGPQFTAVWEHTPVAAGTWWNMTSSDYVTRWNDLYNQGYLQTDFFPYQDNGLKFAGTWKLLPHNGYASYFNITPANWPQFHSARLAEGTKITHFVAYQDGGQLRHGAIWERIPGNYQLTIDTSGAGYQTQFDTRSTGAWQLHQLHSFDADSFAAIWYRPNITTLPNGDLLLSITFPRKQQYVEVFARKNGVQNISGNIVSSQVTNPDGTFSYQRVVPASTYRAGDVILARFYSYEANSPGVFTPGPQSSVWFPAFIYGQGQVCARDTQQLVVTAATASSQENNGLTASKAIDGSLSTRWSSQFSDPQWITLDLGSLQYVARAKLFWETAASASYEIRVSTDNVNWTTVHADTNGNGGTDEVAVNQPARYVRMHSLRRTTQWGNSLWEFQLFGNPSVTCP